MGAIKVRSIRSTRRERELGSLGDILDELDEIEEQIEDLMELRAELEARKEEIKRFGFTEPDPQTIRGLWTDEAQS